MNDNRLAECEALFLELQERLTILVGAASGIANHNIEAPPAIDRIVAESGWYGLSRELQGALVVANRGFETAANPPDRSEAS